MEGSVTRSSIATGRHSYVIAFTMELGRRSLPRASAQRLLRCAPDLLILLFLTATCWLLILMAARNHVAVKTAMEKEQVRENG